MAVYIVCPKCKTEYSVKKKECPKCRFVVKQNKTFRVSVSFHNKRVRQTITGSNLQGAKEIEAKLKSELVSGEYYDRRLKARQTIQFKEFIKEKYLPYAENNKVSWKKEEMLFRLWIEPIMGNKKMGRITQTDIEKLKKTMKDTNKAPKTINYAIDVIRMAFNMAIKWGYADKNPAVGVKRPEKDNRRVRFLTREEFEKLLDELKKHSTQVYEMAYLSLYTGMRFGEIASLTWQDIDFQNDIINIKDPKNNTGRVAYITENLKELLLEKHKREKPENLNELLFKDNSGNKLIRISKTYDRSVNKLGFNDGITDPRDKVVFHTLRHTFASWLAINGTPIYTIKELMGHKSLAMTERYSHLIPDIKREAVEGLSKMDRNNNTDKAKTNKY